MEPLSKIDRDVMSALEARLTAMIDTGDILEARDWSDAQRGRFFQPSIPTTPVAMDAEIVAWFRTSGPGYQERMSAVLRAHMQAQTARREIRPIPLRPQASPVGLAARAKRLFVAEEVVVVDGALSRVEGARR